MSVIIYWMSFGHRYREKENGIVRLVWESDNTTLSYEGLRIQVYNFQFIVQRLKEDIEFLLDDFMDG
jgi:hypothetical protein